MASESGYTPEEIREGLQKLAGLAIVVEVAEHTKTAAGRQFLSRLKRLLPNMPGSSLKKSLAKSEAGRKQLAGTVEANKKQIQSLMDELASSERLSRGAIYAGGVAVPAAGIGAYAYGRKKGKEEGREAFIRELLG
jgi:hypothetical protein